MRVWFMAHPVRACERYTLPENLARARRWLAALRAEVPGDVFVAPWIDELEENPEHDTDPDKRDRGIAQNIAMIHGVCDGVVLVGGKITPGMQREADAAQNVWDRTALGEEPQDV